MKKFVIIFNALLLITIFLSAQNCWAQTTENVKYDLQVTIPGFGDGTKEVELTNYIKAVVAFATAAVVIICITMIMYGGVQWIIGGAINKIDKAKDTIFKALIGLVIALFAVFVLQTINPKTVNLTPLSIPKLEAPPAAGGGGAAVGEACTGPGGCSSGVCFTYPPTSSKMCLPKVGTGTVGQPCLDDSYCKGSALMCAANVCLEK